MRRLVAEIGSCNGDLAYALDCVDAFASAGAWAIKGQLYTADTLTTRDAKPYGKGLVEPATQWEAFTDTLTFDEWGQVKARCDDLGIGFFGSVFNHDAALVGQEQGWPMFKLASGDITYKALIQFTTEVCASSGAVLVFSTGAAEPYEVARVREWIADISPMVLTKSVQLVCTLSYPTELHDANVARIATWRNILTAGSVGYSDHTRGIAAADYAFRAGASLVEKHVTLTPGAGGDHDFAVEPHDIDMLVNGDGYSGMDQVIAGSGNISVLPVEQEARIGARRSIHAAVDIATGEPLTYNNLVAVRPGNGIEPWRVDGIVGLRAQRHIPAGTQLSDEMFGSVVFGLTVE